MAAIRRNRVWFQNNSVMKIGDAHGLPAGCFAECIRHMAAWTSLATSVVRAEFPKFEVAMAFRIFALAEVSQDDRVAGLSIRPDMAGDFQVLASAFKVDAGDLRAEYESLFGIAQHIFRTERLAIRDAWSQAFQRVRRRANSQHGKKTRIIGKILARYLVWVLSSSGVEQNFSIRKYLSLGGRRDNLAPQTELDELQIKTYKIANPQVSALLKEAEKNYHKLVKSGQFRTPRRARLRGYKKQQTKKAGPPSFDKLLQRRRQEIGALPKSEKAGTVEKRGKRLSGTVWSEKHNKEAKRQTNQHRLRHSEAASSGCVVMTSELRGLAAELDNARTARRAKLEAKAMAKASATKRPSYELRRKRVFVASGLSRAEVTDLMLQHHFRIVDDRSQAARGEGCMGGRGPSYYYY